MIHPARRMTATGKLPRQADPGSVSSFSAGKSGIIMLACELIDNNGKELLKCVNQYIDQWELGADFKKYVNERLAPSVVP